MSRLAVLLLAIVTSVSFVPVSPVQADSLTPTTITFASGPVQGEATAEAGQFVYLVGGVGPSGQTLDTIWRLDLSTGSATLLSTRLPFGLKFAAAANVWMPNDAACPYIGDCIVIAGGTKSDGTISNKVFAYHRSTNYGIEMFSEIMTLPEPRAEMGYGYGYIWTRGDEVLVLAGGRTNTGLSRDVLFIDIDDRTTAFRQQLPSARRMSTVFHLSNNFRVIGGYTSSGMTNEIHWFDGQYTAAETPMPTPTAGAVAFDGNQPEWTKPGCTGCSWLVLVGGDGQSDSQAGVPNRMTIRGYDYFDDQWFELGRAVPAAEFQGRAAFSRWEGDRYIGYLIGARYPGSGTAHNVVHKYDSLAQGAPSVPLNLVAAPTGVGQITLNWDTPLHQQSGTLSYRIYRDSESQRHGTTATPYATVTGGALTWTDTGLGAGESHTYSVTAVAGTSESFWSRAANAQTWRAPTEPQSFAAAPGPNNGQIRLTWAAPSSDGGTPVTAYKLYRSDVGLHKTFSSTTTSFVDGGLGDGSFRQYSLSAENAVGESTAVHASATTFHAPGAPENLQASPSSTVGAIQLNWQPPGNDGGRPVTNYRIYRATQSGQEILIQTVGNVLSYVDAPKTSQGLPDLTHPQHYRVQAVTLFGAGDLSAGACSWPGPALPGVDRGCAPLPVSP